MPLVEWIKANQVKTGLSIIGFLIVGGTVVTIYIIKGIKKKFSTYRNQTKGVSRMGLGSISRLSKPSRLSFSFLKKIWGDLKLNKEENRMKTKKSKIPKTEQHGAVPVPPVAPLSMGLQQQMIDVNQLTTEQLERLLQERKAQEVVQTEQATLMAMDKEELVQIIIDNQVEF